MIYYEDLMPGEITPLGSTPVTADGILSFARRYDPQPFHLSDAGAADTYFGSLAASGWHTAAMTMKLMMTGRGDELASLGSPGIDGLRWHHPVYPDDVLSATATVTDKRVSQSRPEMGIVHLAVETRNQDDRVVLTLTSIAFIKIREP